MRILNFIILFCILFSVWIVIVLFIVPQDEQEYTKEYQVVSVSEAKQILDTVENVTVIDCTGGCQPCSWKNGHIDDALWNDNPTSFYNLTNDILVYDDADGNLSLSFCQSLVNHVYGKIYCLRGGYQEWVK